MIHDQRRVDDKLRTPLAQGSSREDAIRRLHADEMHGLLWLARAAVNVVGPDRRDAQRLVVRVTCRP